MEPCSICGGKMTKQKVEVIKKVNNKVVVVKETPAWVCTQCGERYYSIETVKQIERILRDAENNAIELHKIFAGETFFRKPAVSG